MPSNNIYVWKGGEYDPTRWITISHRGGESCAIHLADLCQPGKPSRFTSVHCLIAHLKTALHCGALQVTLSNGFLLVRQENDQTHIEFRSRDDVSPIKSTFKTADILARIAAIEEDATRIAVTA